MKKAGKIVARVISLLILLFAVFIMIFTIISVSTVNKEDADFFGCKPFIVLSDSMRAEFEVGDIVVSKDVDTSTLKEGDIITFRSIDPSNYGGVMTHKIRQVTTYEGEPAFITYGTTTGVDDAYPVPADNVIGQYSFHLPKMGYLFQFLKSVPGYFILIFTPFMILIILQAVKFFRLLKQYKREQREELDKKNAALESERLKTRQMQEELERLKAQMSQRPGQSAMENRPVHTSQPVGRAPGHQEKTVNPAAPVTDTQPQEMTAGNMVDVSKTAEARTAKSMQSIYEDLERLKKQMSEGIDGNNDDNKRY